MNMRYYAALATLLTFASGAVAAKDPPPVAKDPQVRIEKREVRCTKDAARPESEPRCELLLGDGRTAPLPRHAAEGMARGMAVRKAKLRPVLGVLLAPDERAGVQITGITPGSGAAKAGLKSGDRIVSVDGKQVMGSNGSLRVENLRTLLGKLDAGKPVRIGYQRDGRSAVASVMPQAEGHAFLLRGDAPVAFPRDGTLLPGVAPRIHREVVRLGDCKDGACKGLALAEAFRWHGLNLASVDPQLGRYFGTDRGVLVLSTGGALAELQPGDVVQKIDGKAVATPREAMAALHAKSAGSKVAVEYLRDRRTATAQVTVPKAQPLRIPVPPTPPAAPPAPPAPPANRKAPTPAPAPAPPAAPAASAERIDDRVMVLARAEATAAPPAVVVVEEIELDAGD
jgi:membrane-associated protease RseP (regulator of RpoE activity)